LRGWRGWRPAGAYWTTVKGGPPLVLPAPKNCAASRLAWRAGRGAWRAPTSGAGNADAQGRLGAHHPHLASGGTVCLAAALSQSSTTTAPPPHCWQDIITHRLHCTPPALHPPYISQANLNLNLISWHAASADSLRGPCPLKHCLAPSVLEALFSW